MTVITYVMHDAFVNSATMEASCEAGSDRTGSRGTAPGIYSHPHVTNHWCGPLPHHTAGEGSEAAAVSM